MPVAETNSLVRRRRSAGTRGCCARITWLRPHPVAVRHRRRHGHRRRLLPRHVRAPAYLLTGLYFIPLIFLALAVNWRAVAFAVRRLRRALRLRLRLGGVARRATAAHPAVRGARSARALVMLVLPHQAPVDDHRVRRAARPALGGGRGHPQQRPLARRPRRAARVRARAPGRAARGHQRRPAAARGRRVAGPRRLRSRRRRAPGGRPPTPRCRWRRRRCARTPALSRDFTDGDPSPLAPLAAHVRLERVLVVPMRSLEREVGVLVFNRPQDSGRVQRRADRARRGRRPLPRRHRRQRAPHGRAQHAAPRPRARARLQPRLRPEPRHGRGARGGRHAARRRPRHARLRHLRGGRRAPG